MGKKALQNFVNLTNFSVNRQKLDLFRQFDEKYEVKAVKWSHFHEKLLQSFSSHGKKTFATSNFNADILNLFI